MFLFQKWDPSLLLRDISVVAGDVLLVKKPYKGSVQELLLNWAFDSFNLHIPPGMV